LDDLFPLELVIFRVYGNLPEAKMIAAAAEIFLTGWAIPKNEGF